PPSSTLFPYTTLFRSSPKLRLRTTRLGIYFNASSLFIALIFCSISCDVICSLVEGNWYFCATVGGSEIETSGSVAMGSCPFCAIDRKSTRLNSSHDQI